MSGNLLKSPRIYLSLYLYHTTCENSCDTLTSSATNIYIYIYYLPIGRMVRVLLKGQGDLGSILGQVIPKPHKWYLMLPYFQKLERYNKCIAAGGDYFEWDKSFMCVLSIKVSIRKKSGNLFNEPCMYIHIHIHRYIIHTYVLWFIYICPYIYVYEELFIFEFYKCICISILVY